MSGVCPLEILGPSQLLCDVNENNFLLEFLTVGTWLRGSRNE